jgi:hypothetical protein
MNIDLSEVTAVLGQKNSGKSVLIEHLLTGMRRFVCIDPQADHGPPGATFVTSPAELMQEWARGNRRIVVRKTPITDEDLTEFLRAFGQITDAYLVIDEAHNFMSEHSLPRVLKLIVKWHISHSNNGLVIGAHQAKEIHDKVWQQVDNYLIFAYGGHEDSKFSSVDIPNKRAVQDLDPQNYRFLYYHDVAGADSEIRGPVPVPRHLS